MSIIIYTYHDPYKIDQEPYWKEINNCPYFCAAQTLVNGLRKHYKGKFDGGRVTTVKWLTDSLYEDWVSPAWIVKQHTDIDNIINSGLLTELTGIEKKNIGSAFLFNRDEVFKSIRTLFELNVDLDAVLKDKLTKEQEYILDIYRKILTSDKRSDFFLSESLLEDEINKGLIKAMTAIYEDYDYSNVDMGTIVIHGVHQFSPIILRAIDELQKYKNVILLFNYQKQYKSVYQTWTESNNIAIQGLMNYSEKTGKSHIITSSIEHKAVLETAKAMEKRGFEVDIVNPDLSGRVRAEQIISFVRDDTLLVSLMHVNNETGIIQPVSEIGNALAERHVLFHVDATQSCGKLVNEIRNLKYNMLSFSAHKMQGPQGIGGLVLRKSGYKLPPVKNIMYGGQQEHGIRPGTIPIALVAGCGCACEISGQNYEKNAEKTKELKKIVLKILNESGLEYRLNGNQDYCVNSTINICIPGVISEALMISSKQYCSLSNGSACTSKSYAPSYVLSAMGIPEEDIECSVRISWGPDTESEELEENFGKLIEIAKKIRG